MMQSIKLFLQFRRVMPVCARVRARSVLYVDGLVTAAAAISDVVFIAAVVVFRLLYAYFVVLFGMIWRQEMYS